MKNKNLVLNTVRNVLITCIVSIVILYLRTPMKIDNPLLYFRGTLLGLALCWFVYSADLSIKYRRRLNDAYSKSEELNVMHITLYQGLAFAVFIYTIGAIIAVLLCGYLLILKDWY
jgi:hypothetical protein